MQNKKNKFRIEKLCFPTVQQLIQHHINARTPVSTMFPDALLVQGVFRQPWEVSHDDLQTVHKIGEGTFGEVYFGYMRIAGKKKRQCVIKIAKHQGNANKNVREIMKEARIMRNFDHPNVVRMFGVAIEKEPMALIMEFVDGGSLEKYLRTANGPISQQEKDRMCCDAAWGLEYLHESHFLHRDIAARNCLYSKLKVLKIADFGLSRMGDAYQLKGPTKLPLKWLAPETIDTGVHTQKSDVYSFGILIWEIYTQGGTPFKHYAQSHIPNLVMQGVRPEFPDNTPLEVKQIVMRYCWPTNPKERLTMQEIAFELEHYSKISPPYCQYRLRDAVDDDLNNPPSDKVSKEGPSKEQIQTAAVADGKPVNAPTVVGQASKKVKNKQIKSNDNSSDNSGKKPNRQKGSLGHRRKETDDDSSRKNMRKNKPAATTTTAGIPEACGSMRGELGDPGSQRRVDKEKVRRRTVARSNFQHG
uniref:Protein kinase domain-containing protein n=1 Tax=Panagrellus redivivus TaxID=6233 RepID=A0A7E4VMA9_PANRE